MNKILEFPNKQHLGFVDIVKHELVQAAKTKEQSLEHYIQGIYFEGEEPELFKSKARMKKLYEQYQDLIEHTLAPLDLQPLMSKSNKVYLCYRIYLHNMSIQRRLVDREKAQGLLAQALREYFYSKKRAFHFNHEMALMKLIDEFVQHLPEQAD